MPVYRPYLEQTYIKKILLSDKSEILVAQTCFRLIKVY
jgi:hypothetical protein